MVTAVLLSLASRRLSFWSKSRRIRRTGGNKWFLGFFPVGENLEAGAVVEATGFSKLFCFAATTMATPLYSRQVIHLFLSSFFTILVFPCQTSLWNKKRWGVRSVISMLDMDFSSWKRFFSSVFFISEEVKTGFGGRYHLLQHWMSNRMLCLFL
jgi:hypothetical protein